TSDAFLYYEKSGRFAENWDAFESFATSAVKNGEPQLIEVAANDMTIDEESMQFIFETNRNIEEILYEQKMHENTHVFMLELRYK
ncbi:MAG: hypothetical protein LBN36_08765, partial [Clostridiales Family XIII bacterium]|nr:hypothetical protein [Clostridiales Family XIII bacterium]